MGYQGRDVEVMVIDRNKQLVVACDSCGAIGLKQLDQVKVAPYLVGRLTTRVALFEVLATAAKPIMVTVASCNEPQPTSEQILAGVNDELRALDYIEIPVAISTEKNIPTMQTGLGITVIGLCEKISPRIATSEPDDDIYCLGIPKVGPEVTSPEDSETAQGKHILELLNHPGVHDIVPVGSGGISKESETLAAQIGCRFEPDTPPKIDLHKSAGPCTCLIFTCVQGTLLTDLSPAAIVKIGQLLKQNY